MPRFCAGWQSWRLRIVGDESQFFKGLYVPVSWTLWFFSDYEIENFFFKLLWPNKQSLSQCSLHILLTCNNFPYKNFFLNAKNCMANKKNFNIFNRLCKDFCLFLKKIIIFLFYYYIVIIIYIILIIVILFISLFEFHPSAQVLSVILK